LVQPDNQTIDASISTRIENLAFISNCLVV